MLSAMSFGCGVCTLNGFEKSCFNFDFDFDFDRLGFLLVSGTLRILEPLDS